MTEIPNESLHRSLLSPYRIESARSLEGVVLDCGGGLGDYLPHFKAERVVVLDVAFDALAALSHSEKLQADACCLPFADDTFSGVWACAVGQYVELEEFVTELKRVTAPGGRILILVPNGASPWDRIKKIFGMPGWWDQEGIKTQYTTDDLLPYGKVTGEIRFLVGERFFRNQPRLCHTLLLEIIVDG